MAHSFAAARTLLRTQCIGANPTASFFAFGINTLNGGARHQRHNALPGSCSD